MLWCVAHDIYEAAPNCQSNPVGEYIPTLPSSEKKDGAVVYAFTIRDHSMGPVFKTYDDRQFCNAHRTVTEGMPFGYLINGDLDGEPNLRTIIEARCEVGHNFLAGAAVDHLCISCISTMAQRLAYALEHRYVQHGIYDFPQKQRGKMLMMCFLGAMVRNPKINAKMGNKMNEGMVAPYKRPLRRQSQNQALTNDTLYISADIQ